MKLWYDMFNGQENQFFSKIGIIFMYVDVVHLIDKTCLRQLSSARSWYHSVTASSHGPASIGSTHAFAARAKISRWHKFSHSDLLED